MTIKKDIVNRIASLGLSQKKAKEAIGAIIEGMGEGLARGEKVRLEGLGSFEIRLTKEKRGRNPRTGEPLWVPSRKVPVFRPAPTLKEKVRK